MPSLRRVVGVCCISAALAVTFIAAGIGLNQANAQVCVLGICVSGKPSPAGCSGQTDYPHVSFNEASVHGRTKCNSNVSSVQVVTTLYRDRWWGWEYLQSDSNAKSNKKQSEDAHPHFNCRGTGTYTYVGRSQHASFENGETYSATTTQYSPNSLSC
jgi:hypothetical protein